MASDHRKHLLATTMASRLAYLADPERQRQELALALEVVADLDDDLLRKACVQATRTAGRSFVLAQHIYAAAEPELRHRAEMARIDRRDRELAAESVAMLPKPDRVTPEQADRIMREVFTGKRL